MSPSAAIFLLLDKKAKNASSVNTTPVVEACQAQPFRHELAAKYIDEGAVITYERNGGLKCIDELYVLYPDGRIVADNGKETKETTTSPEKIETLLANINKMGWFTDNMYSTFHTPCAQCYHYFTTVKYNDEVKTIEAVDGGTDAPANYWQMSGQITLIVPTFSSDN